MKAITIAMGILFFVSLVLTIIAGICGWAASVSGALALLDVFSLLGFMFLVFLDLNT